MNTMLYKPVDRVPYFEEGIRDEVLEKWAGEGLPEDADPARMFPSDHYEEIQPDLDPHPGYRKYPTSLTALLDFRKRLNPDDRNRFPEDWNNSLERWENRDYPVFLRAHRGFFLTMGVESWDRFNEIMYLLYDNPRFVKQMMEIQGEFTAEVAERILDRVNVDAAVFTEPIGGNDGPLLSPEMYEEFVLSSYAPLFHVLRQHGIPVVIFRTYANARVLLPVVVKSDFNCLWAVEVNQDIMDYRSIRDEFGDALRLIGGIDLDVLRTDKQTIYTEVTEKVPPLLKRGGYIPLADGRVRPDIPLQTYRYYRKILWEVLSEHGRDRQAG